MNSLKQIENPLCCGDTYITMTNFSFRWNIHNINHEINSNSFTIESPDFIDPYNKCTWGVSLTKQIFQSKKFDINLQLRRYGMTGKKFVCLTNCIVNDKKCQPYSELHEDYIKNPQDTKKSYPVSSWDLDAITKKNPSIKDLSVIVTLGIISRTHEKSYTLTPLKCKPQLTTLNDFERVFNQKELTDVTLVVNGKDLYAHKVILAARSPVFLAMFKNNSIEKLQNRVEITDSNVDVIEEMLYFMYTGKTHKDETLVRGLLIAADKYDIPELKDTCVQCLFNKIKVTNALEILILADRHSCQELKKKTCEFIVMYKNKIINSAEYTELKNSHPNLMIELFSNITTTKKPFVLVNVPHLAQ